LFDYHCGVIRWGPQGQLSRARKYVNTPDLSAGFHVFGSEFTPHQVRFYFDGQLVNTANIDDFPQPDAFVWLTAIGRDIDNSNLPGTIDFDYFRFYAKPDLIPAEYELVNHATGLLLRPGDLAVMADAPLEIATDQQLFRQEAWQWIETGTGLARLRSTWSSLTLEGSGEWPGTGHLVVADFNDMNLGDLRVAAGQTPGTGIGFGDDGWRVNTGIPRVGSGDLVAPSNTNYAITQPGGGAGQNPRSVYHTSFPDPRNQGRELATAMRGEVWFSFLVEPRDTEDRLGIMFNKTNFNYAASGNRVLALGTQLYVSDEDNQTFLPGAFALDTTSLVVGRLSLGRGTSTNATDHLEVWVDPVLTAGLGLGTPAFDADLTMLPGGTNRITTFHVVAYGDGTGSGRIDAFRMSDSPAMVNLGGGLTGLVAVADVTGIAAHEASLPSATPTTFLATDYDGANEDQEFEQVSAGPDTVRLRHVASGLYVVPETSTNGSLVGLSPATFDGLDEWTLRPSNPVERAFPGSTPLPQNWYWTWMGFAWVRDYPWLYHQALGWVYAQDTGGEEAWFHHPLLGWLGSTPELYPLVYSVDQAGWGMLEFDDGAFEMRLILVPSGTTLAAGAYAEQPVDLYNVIELADYRTIGPPGYAAPSPPASGPGMTLGEAPPPPGSGHQLLLFPVVGADRFYLGLRGVSEERYTVRSATSLTGSWQDTSYQSLSAERLRFLPLAGTAGDIFYRTVSP
jgi:hypothetical protein